mmetsp:Transcript_12216/g.15976  ORF Transcript_12216/g.15976 Transcript_12216/m.15976 type:complete len:374 (-) Transcript_12216:57-1178(-)
MGNKQRIARLVIQATLTFQQLIFSSSFQCGHAGIRAFSDWRHLVRAPQLAHQNYDRPCCISSFRNRHTSASRLHGIFSRSDVMNAAASRGKAEKKEQVASHLSKPFLSDAIDESIHRQNLALVAVELAIEANKLTERSIDILPENSNFDDGTLVQQDHHDTTIPVSKTDRMLPRRLELNQMIDRLKDLKSELEESRTTQLKFESIRTKMNGLGFGSILKQPMQSWKTKSKKERKFGVPLGFDGLVFYSPLGVPILVGRMKAHKDAIMRNAAQGADLWFQVEDYNGSRVLLRSSQVRGTKGSKKCQQMAADIAARYSSWGEYYAYDSIPVMYTDSRKVAKRGGKAGNMKQNKSLGRMFGRPQDVADMTKGFQSS